MSANAIVCFKDRVAHLNSVSRAKIICEFSCVHNEKPDSRFFIYFLSYMNNGIDHFTKSCDGVNPSRTHNNQKLVNF